MWKFKSWKGKDKYLFLLASGVILCILAFPAEEFSMAARSDKASSILADGKQEGNTLGFQSGLYPASGSQVSGLGGDGEMEAVLAASGKTEESYEKNLELRIQQLLQHVEGVGKVDVMIVLKSSAEKVFHMDGATSRTVTEEADSSGGTRKAESTEQDRSTILQSADGQTVPVIEKELFPELSGIIISAEGGGSPAVQAEICAAMEALFGLPAHKIKVLKRVD